MGRIPPVRQTVNGRDRNDEEMDLLLASMPPAEHADDGQLAALHAGTLPPDIAQRVSAHIAECAFCAGLFEALGEPVLEDSFAWAEEQLAAQPESHPWVLRAAGGFAALAAAVVLVIVGWPLLSGGGIGPAPSYERGALLGGVKALRGESTTPAVGPQEFRPQSRLRLDLVPGENWDRQQPRIRVFVSSPDGRLVHASGAKIIFGGEAAGGAIRIEGRGAAIFENPALGDTTSARVLHVVLGQDAEALAELDGEPALEAEAKAKERAMTWLRYDVTYVTTTP